MVYSARDLQYSIEKTTLVDTHDMFLIRMHAKCVKFMCKKRCEMRQIYVQKTVRNASNLCAKTVRNARHQYAKNSAKCVKSICKKQCKMRQINMQKIVRKASNL